MPGGTPTRGPDSKLIFSRFWSLSCPRSARRSDLAIKIPTHETEEWYLSSVNRTVDQFREILQNLLTAKNTAPGLPTSILIPENASSSANYALADKTYTELLARLTSKPRLGVRADLKRNLLDYYEGSLAITEVNDPRTAELEALKAMGSRRAVDGGSSE